MAAPETLKYSKEHEWITVQEDGTALVGITDFAQGELGEIVYIEIDTVGEHIAKDDLFGTIEAVKTTSDLFLPVTGKILEFNPKLDENEGDSPELVNQDPYGDGWLVKIQVIDPAELSSLLTAKEYQELIS